MVWGFFKKKKKNKDQPKQDEPKKATNNFMSEPPTQQKPDPEPQNKLPVTNHELAPDDMWKYESIVQFLGSPLWKNPIDIFINEYSVFFDEQIDEDQEVYKQRKKVHKDFKKLIEGILRETQADYGITDDDMVAITQKGLKTKEHKRLFEQLLVVENYEYFKRLLVKRNKQLEQEVMKELKKSQEKAQQESLQKAKTKEEEDIEKAIAQSLAMEKELTEIEQEEEQALQKALEASQKDYEEYVKKGESKTDLDDDEDILIKSDVVKKFDPKESAQEEAKAEKKEPTTAFTKVDKSLPALGGKKSGNFMASDDFSGSSKSTAASSMTQSKTKESMQERAARLKAQRDLLLAKKKKEMEAEMESYQGTPSPVKKTESKTDPNKPKIPDGMTEEEYLKRKKLYSKLNLY